MSHISKLCSVNKVRISFENYANFVVVGHQKVHKFSQMLYIDHLLVSTGLCRAICRPLLFSAHMTTITQIKKMLESGQIAPSDEDIVDQGVLTSSSGASIPYTLHRGWDIAKCYSCDEHWGKFNLDLFEFIDKQNYTPNQLDVVLAQIQIDDRHWKWFKKACLLKDETYEWFFIMAEGKPQGACLIYHPKKSVINTDDIFYVEFLAVAPWNRTNPMAPRYFNGVGTLLIKSAITYVKDSLAYRFGFSLHALPRASGYYKKIGMERFSAEDKDTLEYFEMPESAAADYLEAP